MVQPGGGGERREATSKAKPAQQRFEIMSERSPDTIKDLCLVFFFFFLYCDRRAGAPQ
jgi:hypothetical protein